MADLKEEKKIDDLVAYLDGFMEAGGGHVNVTGEGDTARAEEVLATGCASKNAACRIPNLKTEKENEK